MRKRHAQEDGWILITAISLMTVMLVVALASISLVDRQQERSREQRERESSLNLAEGAMFAQGFQLARGWPSTAARAVPSDCAYNVVAAHCPTAAQVQQNADNVDTRADTTWSTAVRDNGGNMAVAWQSQFMNAAQTGTTAAGASYTCPAPCRWDANGDRKMWVQASAVVRGQPRTVVATLKLEKLAENTPRTAVMAGGINTGNKGGQVKIWGVGSQVVVRCNPGSSSCVSDQNGIEPDAVYPSPPPPNALMTPAQLDRFKQRAINDGTYYDGCPPGNNIAGAVVWVDKCNLKLSASLFPATSCTPPPDPSSGGGNGLQPPCINSVTAPGVLIWHCGTMDLSGKATYFGLLYFVNGSDGTCPATGEFAPRGSSPPDCSSKTDSDNVFSSTGGFGVYGALAVDGNGCLMASANGMQIQFDANVFNSLASYGTVGLVQDTWRELTPY
jgi:Tfp pilus assembly protein PilX